MKDEHSLVLLHRLLIARSSENSPSRQGQFPSLSPKTIQHSKKREFSSKTSRLVLPNFSLEQSSLKEKRKLNPFSIGQVLQPTLLKSFPSPSTGRLRRPFSRAEDPHATLLLPTLLFADPSPQDPSLLRPFPS